MTRWPDAADHAPLPVDRDAGGACDSGVEGRPCADLLVLWHSGTGGALAMADAACDGALQAEPGLRLRRRHAQAADASDVLAARAVLLVTPEYLGGMAGLVKDFFDRAYYPLLGRCEGLAWSLMVCAGSDGQGAVRQARRIATGLRWREVAEPLVVCTHAQTPEAILAEKRLVEADLAACAERGALMAAGIAMGVL